MNGRESIVVVDDSKFMLMALSSILSPYYQVHSFHDPMVAIENIAKIAPSLVFLDVIMPKIGGFEVLKQIKDKPKTRGIPVIMMTAQDDEDGGSGTEVQCFMMGAVDYVRKPFKAPVVLARARSHVNLYQYQRELEKTSVTDALTTLYNRRGFDDFLNREWSRSVRENTLLSLCMLDIDHFKQYNDNYGHQEGDNALNMVGQALKNALHRPTDTAARYGGEEFAVILPEVDEDGAKIVAGHLNKTIMDLHIKHEHSSAADVLTVSIGVATSRAIAAAEDLIKAADTMLYQAKETGRNRFCHTVV